MKQFSLFIVFFICLKCSYSQTLFTYGKNAVTKDEFLRAYNKNKTIESDNEKALREYLGLYINYKLKVQAAKDAKMDTLASLQSDLENFRTQIEEGYLKDDKQTEALVTEAFQRSQKDIHALHFFVRIDNKMIPADTLKLLRAINETYDELKKGNTDYDELIGEIKKEIAPVKGSDIGYITTFTLPYEFENIIYRLKPGEVSKPYRSGNGWHVFKNTSERPAAGKIKVAQILFSFPAGNNTLRDQAKKIADSVFKAIKGGADFGEMARQYSNDRMTFMNGGEMPEFGIGKYDGTFETEAFSLKTDGEIAEPFQTEYGYHILKRISKFSIPENNDNEVYLSVLKQEVQNDARIETAKTKFLKEILSKTGFKKNPAINYDNLWRLTDSSLISNKSITAGNLNNKSILFSFNNANVSVGDWLQYLQRLNENSQNTVEHKYALLLNDYINIAATENYRKRLEQFSPAFRQQMIEFREGNMLFEIMDKNVWSKANSDSIGLKYFYDQHKDKYKWETSADAILFSCVNSTIANQVIDSINKGDSWREIVSDNSAQVQADSGRYELSQIPVVERTNFTKGLITAPVINQGDGTTTFANIISLYPQEQPRSFDEARGMVVNDYQIFLEKKWIEQLKKKYPVIVQEKVFQTLL
ncbi:MAG: peptidylprolyl isomerase [Ginsengibacter sp.]